MTADVFVPGKATFDHLEEAPCVEPARTATGEEDFIAINDIIGESVVSVARAGDPTNNHGTTVTFKDKLTNSAGEDIGWATGWASVYVNPNTGKSMEWCSGVYHFPDGDVSYQGIVYIDLAIQGVEQSFTAIGTSGRYLGKTGNLSYQLAQDEAPKPDTPLLYRIRIYLGIAPVA